MTTTTSQPELASLSEDHGPILRMALSRTRFRRMPEGGQEAIDAGLVVQTDPTWMMSDDIRACNGFALTTLGERAALFAGIAKNCQCAGCTAFRAGKGWEPVLIAAGDCCDNCRASMDQYGVKEYCGQPSCGWHAKLLTQITA